MPQEPKKLETVSKIPDVKLSEPVKTHLKAMQNVAPDNPVAYYAVPKDGFFERVFDIILQTAAGENTAGKIIGRGKNIISYFVPMGSQMDTLTDQIGQTLKQQIKPNKMNYIASRLKEKSTWRGIVAVLAAIGVALTPDQTAAIVTAGVAIIGLFEAFFKEPKSADAG